MGIQKELTLDLVLTFQSEENARHLGRSLWAGLEEVVRYFTPSTDDGLAVPLPSRSGEYAVVLPRFRRWYAAQSPPPFDVDSQFVELTDEVWSGSLHRRTQHDHLILGAGISALIADASDTPPETFIIVVDREIVPPPEWRYVLWSPFPGGTVLSTAAMDPKYWGADLPDADRQRKLEMKHGMRASVLCITGTRVGLSRCENPSCFMFAAVDSVARLPEMRHLGSEHTVTGLSRGVFPVSEPDPETVIEPQQMEVA